MARPLSRALSSPLVTLSPQGSPQEQINISKQVSQHLLNVLHAFYVVNNCSFCKDDIDYSSVNMLTAFSNVCLFIGGKLEICESFHSYTYFVLYSFSISPPLTFLSVGLQVLGIYAAGNIRISLY